MLAVADLKGNHSIHAEAVYTFGTSSLSSSVILPSPYLHHASCLYLSLHCSPFGFYSHSLPPSLRPSLLQASPAWATKLSPCISTISRVVPSHPMPPPLTSALSTTKTLSPTLRLFFWGSGTRRLKFFILKIRRAIRWGGRGGGKGKAAGVF